MIKKIAILPLLLLGLLIACEGKEELIKENPDYVEEGYGVLKLTLNSSTATKAVGDPLTGDNDVALAGESDIKSVAFFIHTEGTADGNGHFQAYFSEKQADDDDFMDLAADNGNCSSAILRFRSDAWQNPQVMVVANYKENGTLAKQLENIKSWEELKSVTVNAVVEEPENPDAGEVEPGGGGGGEPALVTSKAPSSPLLMYTLQTIDQWKMSEGRVGGGPATVTFVLQRLVSRIDIRNYANLETVDADKRFVLESVEIVNSNSDPFLMATVEQTAVPGESVVYPEAGGSISVDAEGDGHQYIDGLYMYENSNADNATATCLKIKGKLNGQSYQKTVLLQTQLAPVEPIALQRNHRYVVNIMPEAERQEVSFSIEVQDWDEGETLYAQPSFPAPTWESVEVPNSGFTWTSATKTLAVTSATTVVSGTFKFKTTGNCATEVSVFYRYDYGGTSLTTKGDISSETPGWVTRGTPTFSFESSKVVTAYDVTIPKQVEDELVPLDILVCTRNANSNTYNDTLVIQYRPEYKDASYAFESGETGNKKPHLVSGKYWAPVNLGATKIYTGANYSLPQKLETEEAMNEFSAYTGLCYQWGRPVGFGGKVIGKTTDTQATFTAERTITYTGDNATKFILRAGDWCSNPGILGLNRWNSGTNANPKKVKNDPCPRGWRIPTSTEMSLLDSNGKSEQIDGKYKKIKEDDNASKYMYLPAAGFYSGALGTDNGGRDIGVGRYYVANLSSSSGNAPNYMFLGLGASGSYPASACPIRCIQNDGPEVVEVTE